jgi:hypothetical protein
LAWTSVLRGEIRQVEAPKLNVDWRKSGHVSETERNG